MSLLFLETKWRAVLSFSPVGAEMAGEHVYFPNVCGGRGPAAINGRHTLTTAPAPHPTVSHPHPTDPHSRPPLPPV